LVCDTRLQDRIRERRLAVREDAENAERAAILDRELTDLRADLTKHERRQAAFSALGDGRAQYPLSTWVPGYGEIAFAPLQSLRTGDELAK
jgi:hypothetical protein